MIARCLIEPAGREDDRSSVLSAELLRDADSCAVSFEVDIYERDIRSLTSRQLERFARRVRRPEYGKSCVFEYRRRTAGDDCFIFDDQYDHHTVRFFLTPLGSQATSAAAGSNRGGVSGNYRPSCASVANARARTCWRTGGGNRTRRATLLASRESPAAGNAQIGTASSVPAFSEKPVI